MHFFKRIRTRGKRQHGIYNWIHDRALPGLIVFVCMALYHALVEWQIAGAAVPIRVPDGPNPWMYPCNTDSDGGR